MKQIFISGHGGPEKLELREAADPSPKEGDMPFFHPVPLMNKNLSVFGVNLGHMWHETDKIRLWMNELLRGVADGWVRPHVDSAFGFEQAGEAHTHIEARKNTGKVVLTP